jgi:hypothetical protein
MNLEEARDTLRDSILHKNPDADFYGERRLDRAIRAVGKDFVHRTKCTRKTTAVSTTADQRYVDITAVSGASSFEPGLVTSVPYISTSGNDAFNRLRGVDFVILRGWYSYTDSSRQPEYYAFQTRDKMYLYPVPDGAYELTIEWDEPFTSFTIGTADPSSVELNIPEHYIDEVLWQGARARLLRGLPGHPEAEAAAVEYERLVNRAKGETYTMAPYIPSVEPEDGPFLRGVND